MSANRSPRSREWLPSLTSGMLWASVSMTLLGSCISSAPPKPKSPDYQPNFQYSVPDSGHKIDVTVGVVAPQYSGDGVDYWSRNKADEVGRSLARALRTSFTELFVAKGFNAAGPFDELDNMTFPEKKGCDFVIYPDLDISIAMSQRGGMAPAAPTQEKRTTFSLGSLTSGGKSATPTCSATLVTVGTIQLTVKEPLSGEKMWIKKVEVSQPSQNFSYEGADCELQNGTLHGARASWAKAHEDMFQTVMKSLDRYVNAEEFRALKSQSLMLREKKVF